MGPNLLHVVLRFWRKRNILRFRILQIRKLVWSCQAWDEKVSGSRQGRRYRRADCGIFPPYGCGWRYQGRPVSFSKAWMASIMPSSTFRMAIIPLVIYQRR